MESLFFIGINVCGWNFPGLWGCYFVGSAIRVILINIKQLTVYRSVGVLIHVRWLPTKAMNIGPPRNNDDSIEHSYIISVLYFCVLYLAFFLKKSASAKSSTLLDVIHIHTVYRIGAFRYALISALWKIIICQILYKRSWYSMF